MSPEAPRVCKRGAPDAAGLPGLPLDQPWGVPIKERLLTLHQRLIKNGDWNLGERLEVAHLERLARDSLAERAGEIWPPLEGAWQQRLVAAAEQRRELIASERVSICESESSALDRMQELCRTVGTGRPRQVAADVVELYRHAASARLLLNKVLVSLRVGVGLPGEAAPAVKFAEVRSLACTFDRLLSRFGDRRWQCGEMCDVVQGSFTVRSVAQGNAVLEALMAREDICAVSVVDHSKDDGSTTWGDVRILLLLNSDRHKHKCEVRIVHHRLADIARGPGGDEEHRRLQLAQELLELAREPAKVRKLDAGSDTQMSVGIPGPRGAAGPLALSTALALECYADIPLSEYRDDGNHLFINADFPGLRAIHRDPWIFLVPGLLAQDECERLMIKGSSRMTSNDRFTSYAPDGGVHRTSSELRIARGETRGLQSRYSHLLRVPAENLEAAKVTRYGKGQYFKNHVDPLSNTTNLENRIATLFVYLNNCADGGETRFLSLPSKRQLEHVVGEKVCCLHDGEGDFPGVITTIHPNCTADVKFDDGDQRDHVPFSELRAYEVLSVKPLQGMGVLFFPAYLPSSPLAVKSHKQLDRHLTHEGSAAVDEKWVHQSWVWPSRPQAHYDGVETDNALL